MVNLKKLGTLSLMLMSLMSAISQTNESSTFVGINGSADYCYRIIKTDQAFQWIADLREDTEVPVFSFHTGFTFFHEFANKLRVETGIQYLRLGEKLQDYLFTTSSGLSSSSNKLITNYNYIGVPLKIGYGFKLRERVKLVVASGVSANIFLSSRFKSSMDWSNGETTTSKTTYFSNVYGLQRLNFAALLSVGLEVKLSSSFTARFEPNASYSINSIVDAPIKQHPYAFGLNGALFYKLGSRKK